MINIKKVNSELQDKIIQEYKDGKSMRQLEKDYGVGRISISKFLEEKQIKTTKGNHYRLYTHQFDYFENITTEHQAYWLGWMMADGYITNNENRYGEDRFGLSVALEDIDILEKFKNDLHATNPIHQYQRAASINSQPLCRLEMTSQQTVDNLQKYGCVKQKSHILEPPKNLPDTLIPAFLRGFFEGDGCISKSKGGPNYTDGYSYNLDITATEPMAKWIFDYFKMGYIRKEQRREFTWYWSIGGHKQVAYILNILYNNSTIYLNRKYQRVQNFLTKYAERQGSNG